MIRNCLTCGKEFKTVPSIIKKGYGKYCSHSCRPPTYSWRGKTHSPETKQKMREAHIGSKNPNWKGGKFKDEDGYILIKKLPHPFCNNNGYVREHRLIMEKHLGRYLTPEEIVHHKGIKYPLGSIENKHDNRIENIRLFKTKGKHTAFHRKLKKNN